MEGAYVILQQIGIIFILIAAGVVLYKTGFVTEKGSKQLSNIVINVVSPAVIISAYQTEYRHELVEGLLYALVMTVAVYIISIILSYVLVRDRKGRETAIERLCIVYSNCGFMGIPLIEGMFGPEGVFYVSASITIFNIFIWTHGAMTMCGSISFRDTFKALRSPNIIAIVIGLIFFFGRVRIPEVPLEALRHFANMNTPLAMLVAGITIAATDLKKTVRNPRILVVSFLKLILIPTVCMVVMMMFGAPYIVYMVVVLTTACPTAGMTTILALRYDKNAGYCSELFASTTILSAVTLTVITICANFLSA